jgi:hypothetical protein
MMCIIMMISSISPTSSRALQLAEHCHWIGPVTLAARRWHHALPGIMPGIMQRLHHGPLSPRPDQAHEACILLADGSEPIQLAFNH